MSFGLVSLIGFALSTVIINANKQQKGVQAKDQQREVTSEIRTLLGDRTACLNSLGGNDPDAAGTPRGFTVLNLKDGTVSPGNVRYVKDSNDKTGLLKFNEFRVTNWIQDASVTRGTADLVIKFSKVDTSSGTATFVAPDIITLRILRDATTGNITDCFSIGKQSDGIWQITPTNSNNIMFRAGFVGIGTDTPLFPLQISNGNTTGGNNQTVAQIGDANGAVGGALYLTHHSPYVSGNSYYKSGQWNYGGAAGGKPVAVGLVDGFHFFTSQNAVNSAGTTITDFTETMVIDSSGNVGIGTTSPAAKLEVAGGIKPGTGIIDASCNTNPEGTFAYDNVAHAPVYCNSSGKWVAMGATNYYMWDLYFPSICTQNGPSVLLCPNGAQLYLPSMGPIHYFSNPITGVMAVTCYGPTTTWVGLGTVPPGVKMWKCQ